MENSKPLILCLGNDIIADDALGIAAAHQLRDILGDLADVEESAVTGMALLEVLTGYERVIILDAIHTQRHPPGTILEFSPADLSPVQAPSPHYAGLPELIATAGQLELPFPETIIILAMEVADPLTIGGEMTQPVRDALPQLIERVTETVSDWQESAIK